MTTPSPPANSAARAVAPTVQATAEREPAVQMTPRVQPRPSARRPVNSNRARPSSRLCPAAAGLGRVFGAARVVGRRASGRGRPRRGTPAATGPPDRHRAHRRRRRLEGHRPSRLERAARQPAGSAPDHQHHHRRHRTADNDPAPPRTRPRHDPEPHHQPAEPDHNHAATDDLNQEPRHADSTEQEQEQGPAHLCITILGCRPAFGRGNRRSARLTPHARVGCVMVLRIASGYSPDYLLKEVATARENHHTGAVVEGEAPGVVGRRRGEARPARALTTAARGMMKNVQA